MVFFEKMLKYLKLSSNVMYMGRKFNIMEIVKIGKGSVANDKNRNM